jgi:RNA 2',3'-cyclic 3'-phosphodiesterase
MSEVVRAFVALPLRPETLAVVEERCRPLREHAPQVRFARPETLHLTLRFLGETELERLERMLPSLERAAAGCPLSFGRLAGLGIFPPRGEPRVLWLGIDLEAPVMTLQRDVERLAVDEGFPLERRPFRPHLTLGRFRPGGRRPALPEVEPVPAPLERLVLFRSQLRPEGAAHTPIASFALGRGPAPG